MTKRSGSVVEWAWSLIRLDFAGIVFVGLVLLSVADAVTDAAGWLLAG